MTDEMLQRRQMQIKGHESNGGSNCIYRFPVERITFYGTYVENVGVGARVNLALVVRSSTVSLRKIGGSRGVSVRLGVKNTEETLASLTPATRKDVEVALTLKDLPFC
ncbi:hypothetical protein GEV33_009842 [Tenebrio molitor]|uniref:Uncharacterized protein n=1 Tax=Tenebrio molitor TaxID=7067 RepID=A0A8J6L7G4_TENMO|nr:hypothetical protein GEV33_009842 [Tenebrio molitor]